MLGECLELGSGKSTFAKTLGGIHLEADMYYIDPINGEYKFDFSRIKDAHRWCQDEVKSYMMSEVPKIVVSNTFTMEWELKPYFEMAEQFGYNVFSIIVENRHDGKNIHDVPDDVISSMKNRFEVKI